MDEKESGTRFARMMPAIVSTARDMVKKAKLFHQTLVFSYSEPSE